MRKSIVRALTATLTAVMLFGSVVNADGIIDKPYLSLGADLKASEKSEVLRLLGVDEAKLDQYDVVTITNADEHNYLDNYLSASIIGTRALSSVLVEKKEEGNGINVMTKNISYCTPGMYQNALSTAGVTDADVVVAGPFELTGTAALVGAMKAYSKLTGENISEESVDAATQELVVTGEIADSIEDSDKAEAFIAKIKEMILSKGDASDETIDKVIEEAEEELDVTVTEDQKEQIHELMEKIDKLDIDVNQLKEQAKEIYEKVKGMDIDTQGIFDKLIQILQQLVDALSSFLNRH